MIRIFKGSGLTSSISLQIPYNRKWKLLSALISLVSSSTSGTRSAYLIPYFGQSSIGGNAYISISTSTVSATTNSVCQIGNQNANSQNLPYPPILTEFDELQIDVSLQSGDSYSYWIEVEEEEA
ncbi:MAG: hypothetical protein QXP36_07885 [Conexivisphaerales archaeon]